MNKATPTAKITARFEWGTQDAYDNRTQKDDGLLFLTTDTLRIFKGEDDYSSPKLKICRDEPTDQRNGDIWYETLAKSGGGNENADDIENADSQASS